MNHMPTLNRRAFVIGSAALGTGLAIGLDIPFGGPTVVRAADDEGTAIHLIIHGCLPHALAAAWIAARTCWKVPQRQILVMFASMSASVGFGFSFNRAATAMIMPVWQ